MTEPKNYKDTLNLPQTSFSMKANLAQREPEMLKAWEMEGVYPAIRAKSAGKPKYLLHDGPPYANGHIHIGHALNKVLKDLIVKYQTMRGHDALYVPGWDCHGLPIEHACLKEMGKRKEEVDRVEFRKQARKYAEKFIEIQREEFKRLGIFGEWQDPYLTMSYGYQASIAASFLKLYEEGFIEQRLKPVPWCYDCDTALAEAELEYEDKISKSVFVKFPAEDPLDVLQLPAGAEAFFLVWTTTPWTLPANVGVAVHPELEYGVFQKGHEVFIFAEALKAKLKDKIDLGCFSNIRSVTGRELKGLGYQHPFLERKGKVILADYVSSEDGTGIVHIAPGHGEDDYQYGHLDNSLPIFSPVDSKGRFTEEFHHCHGEHVFKANPKITALLSEKGLLLKEEDHPHSYPHCWRCKKPIIFRATTQWFMKIDHKDLRKRMLEVIEKDIQFIPDWGKNRIKAMVETRPEWCLSRQRYWGVPIPVIRCRHCAGVHLVKESKAKILELFEKEGADAWFAHPAAAFMPHGAYCPKCGKNEFDKETDIIDVWFDSGVSHQAVLHWHPGLRYPADLYLEGSDQHRGWFQSALTTAMALENKSSFKSVLTHGFVMDGQGKKMSKSASNVVTPQDVMKEFGADVLRLWVTSCDYQFDVRLSNEILKQLVDTYRKIRNTFRYFLSNLYDFDPAKHAVPYEKLHPLDRWAMVKTDHLVASVTEFYERFEFHEIYREVYDFCVVDLSAYYLDALKDTLYTAAPDSWLRRSAQTAFFYILSRMVKIVAPILPFTADEVWRSYKLEERVTTVHASAWPVPQGAKPGAEFRDWEHLREVRNAVTPFLEKKREAKEIRAGLEAKVIFTSEDPESAEILHRYEKELARVLVVSQVVLETKTVEGMEAAEGLSAVFQKKFGLKVLVTRADGAKCARCWNYSSPLGRDPDHESLCPKCVEALRGTKS
ncbi:MAG: isoleucine--tRNA ligase [Candidatus Omnitrophota bacterium]